MNIYIMVDMEGISGIHTREQTKVDGLYFEEGRRYLTADVNACAEACKEAGADKVYVRDAHNNGSFIMWEGLSPAVDYIVKGGAGYLFRYEGVDDCDGVILLGYHAMTGTENGIITHTMDLENHYYVNGVEYGEIGLDAAMAAEHQKPIIMVSGDDKACAEAKSFLPWVTTCEVKRGLGWDRGLLLAPAKAYAKIREKTIEAINDLKNKKIYEQSKPVTVLCTAPERKPRLGSGEDVTRALLARVEIDEKDIENK